MTLTVKEFTLTDGYREYRYGGVDMTPELADKIVELMHAWKRHHVGPVRRCDVPTITNGITRQ
jgi:hypothetical protein